MRVHNLAIFCMFRGMGKDQKSILMMFMGLPRGGSEHNQVLLPLPLLLHPFPLAPRPVLQRGQPPAPRPRHLPLHHLSGSHGSRPSVSASLSIK